MAKKMKPVAGGKMTSMPMASKKMGKGMMGTMSMPGGKGMTMGAGGGMNCHINKAAAGGKAILD